MDGPGLAFHRFHGANARVTNPCQMHLRSAPLHPRLASRARALPRVSRSQCSAPIASRDVSTFYLGVATLPSYKYVQLFV